MKKKCTNFDVVHTTYELFVPKVASSFEFLYLTGAYLFNLYRQIAYKNF